MRVFLILAPILFPIATRLGIDPIHLGIIMVVNMGRILLPLSFFSNELYSQSITCFGICIVVNSATFDDCWFR